MDDTNLEQVVPPLPSIFDGSPNPDDEHFSDVHTDDAAADNHHDASTEEPSGVAVTSGSATDLLLTSNASSAKLALHDETHDAHHEVGGELGEATLFDSEMERDFVSTLLENSESAVDLAALHD